MTQLSPEWDKQKKTLKQKLDSPEAQNQSDDDLSYTDGLDEWRLRLLYGTGYLMLKQKGANSNAVAYKPSKPLNFSMEPPVNRFQESELLSKLNSLKPPVEPSKKSPKIVIRRKYHYLSHFFPPGEQSMPDLQYGPDLFAYFSADELRRLNCTSNTKKVGGPSERLMKTLARPTLPELFKKAVLSSEQQNELNNRLYYGSLAKDKTWSEKIKSEMGKATAASSPKKLDTAQSDELCQRLFYHQKEVETQKTQKLIQKYCPAPSVHRFTVDEEKACVQRLYDESIEKSKKLAQKRMGKSN